MLNMREFALERIRADIGDGFSMSLRYDSWHPVGPLFKLVNPEFVATSELNSDVRVVELIRGNSWVWLNGDFWRWLESQTPTRLQPWPNMED